MLGQTPEIIASTWSWMLVGGALLVAGGVGGWKLSVHAGVPLVEFVERWVRRVVEPLVAARRWRTRALGIFANNVATLALLVLLGRWAATATLGVMACGVFLGAALRVLSDRSGWARRSEDAPPALDWRVLTGLALNLLEPPAILAAVGLALGQTLVPIEPAQAWRAFGVIVAPTLLVAACGEALWIGAVNDSAGGST